MEATIGVWALFVECRVWTCWFCWPLWCWDSCVKAWYLLVASTEVNQTILLHIASKGYVQRIMSLWTCMAFTSRERKYPRKLVMVKFPNLMEQVTTKTWSKLLKGTLYQGIQAFIGMRIFSIQVFLWRRREIILLLTLKTGSHHNLLQISKTRSFGFNSLLIWLQLSFCCWLILCAVHPLQVLLKWKYTPENFKDTALVVTLSKTIFN